MSLRWLMLLLLTFGSCPGTAAVDTLPAPEYELVCDAQGLRVLHGGRELCAVTAQAPLPYAIAAGGPPALIVVCGTELIPTTYAAGDPPQAYRNMLPLYCDPPLVALAPLPDVESGQLGATVLLQPGGGVLWEHEQCELLLPAGGAIDNTVAYAAMAHDGEILTPFGNASLAAIDLASGKQLWNSELAAREPVVGVELWALDANYGLVSLQYSYEDYEFASFDRRTGELGGRTALAGQPATVLTYPGPDEAAAGVTAGNGTVEFVVHPLGGKAQLWRFTLASGEVAKSAAAGIPPFRREDNALPVGGSGTPGPAAPPFAQAILPTQAGGTWRIPALVDATLERVLIVDAAGARWVRLTPGA